MAKQVDLQKSVILWYGALFVCPARPYSIGCKSLTHPNSGKRPVAVTVTPQSLGYTANCIVVEEPLYAERHVQWCERSENEVGGKLLHFPPTRLLRHREVIINIFFPICLKFDLFV